MEFYIPSLGKGSVRDAIIEILADESEISIKNLRAALNKKFAVSYQAVYKALKELVSKGILEKKEEMYKIKGEWIAQLKEFLHHINFSHKNILRKLKNNKIVKIEFKNAADFGRFAFDFLESLIEQNIENSGNYDANSLEFRQDFPNLERTQDAKTKSESILMSKEQFSKNTNIIKRIVYKKKNIFVNCKQILNMFWQSKEEHTRFMKAKEFFDIRISCDDKTETTSIISKFWEEIGAKIDYGANYCSICDFIAVDDYISELP